MRYILFKCVLLYAMIFNFYSVFHDIGETTVILNCDGNFYIILDFKCVTNHGSLYRRNNVVITFAYTIVD